MLATLVLENDAKHNRMRRLSILGIYDNEYFATMLVELRDRQAVHVGQAFGSGWLE